MPSVTRAARSRPSMKFARKPKNVKPELAAAVDILKRDQPAWEQRLHERLRQLPIWNGVWHSVGPFPAGRSRAPTLAASFRTAASI